MFNQNLTRLLAFWQHFRAQQVFQAFSQLLENDPPKMPRKFSSNQLEIKIPK